MKGTTHLLTEEAAGWRFLQRHSNRILSDFWGPKRYAKNWQLPDGPIRQVVQHESLDHLAHGRSLRNEDITLIANLCNFTLFASALVGRRSRSYEEGLADFSLKLLQMGSLLGTEKWAFGRLSPSGRRVWLILAALGRELERPGGYTLSDLRIMGRFVSPGYQHGVPGRDAARGFVRAFVSFGVLAPVKRRGHQPTYSYRNRWISTLTASREADIDYARHLLGDGFALVRESRNPRRRTQITPIAIGCYYVGRTRLPNRVRRVLSELVDTSSFDAARKLLRVTTRGVSPGGPNEPQWLQHMSSSENRPVMIVDIEHFLRGYALKPGKVVRSEKALRDMWRASATRAVSINGPRERPAVR